MHHIQQDHSEPGSLSGDDLKVQSTLLRRISNEDMLSQPQLMETRHLAKCYISYAKRNPRQGVSCLLELLTVFQRKSQVDYSFVRSFLQDGVAEQFSVADKQWVSLLSQITVCKRVDLCQQLSHGNASRCSSQNQVTICMLFPANHDWHHHH